MGWADTWIEAARVALIGVRPGGPMSTSPSGSGWAGDDTGGGGVQLPALSASDMLGVVGAVSPGVVGALNSWASGAAGSVAVRSDLPDSDGRVSPELLAEFAATIGMNARDYLAGFTAADRRTPWLRSPTPLGLDDAGTTFTVWMTTTFKEPALLAFVKQLVSDHTTLCDAVAYAIQAAPAGGAQQPSDAANVRNFWSALGGLCSTLDVLQENPPTSAVDVVKGALQSALHATEEFVGKSLADVSAEAGKAAGNVAHGFFDNAGLLSVAVAGIALFLALK